MGSNDRLDCPVCITLVKPKYQTAEAKYGFIHAYDSRIHVECAVCRLVLTTDDYRKQMHDVNTKEEDTI